MNENILKSMTESERKKYISDLPKNKSNSYNIAGKSLKLDHTQVPLEILRFRVENGRWLLDLEEIAKNNHSNSEDYINRSEDNEIQDILYKIALRYSKQKSGNKSIYDELKDSAGQTDSLIIFSNGVVFNGNRRLAAMRKLQEELTPTKFKYPSVEVDILPETISQAELDMFESSLQRKISLPLEFSWIDTASQAYKYRKEKKKDKDIIELLNLKQSSQSVDNEIKKFTKASEFLIWISKRREDVNENGWTWFKNQNFKQVFETACGDGGKKGTLVFEGPNMKLSTLIFFNILENAALEKDNPNYISDSAHDYMTQHNGIINNIKNQKIKPQTMDDIKSKDDTYNLINQAFVDTKSNKEKEKLHDLVIKNLQTSKGKINGINLSDALPDDYDNIESLLKSIKSIADELLDNLNSFRKN